MAFQDKLKDTVSALWRKIKANIDRSAFIFFFILLVLMSGIYGYEITRPEPELINPTPGPMPTKLPNDDYQKAVNYIKSNTDLEKDDQLKVIKYFNIFDYKKVRDKNELQKDADKKYTRAQALFEEGKKEEAAKLLRSILLTWPSHLSSRDLLSKIESTPTPTPTPTPAKATGLPDIPGMPGMGM